MKRSKNIYWGLILILAGTTMVLNMFGLFEAFNVFKIAWSIIFIALFFNALYKMSFVSAALYAAILTHINIDLLGLQGGIFPIYAASLLIGVGLSSIFKKRRRKSFVKYKVNGFGENMEFNNFQDLKHEYKNRSSTDSLKGKHVYFENNLGSSIRYVKSDNLKSATIENNIGTSNIYFNDVTFDPDGCTIHVECNLGKINIYLPQNINYQNNIATTLASVKTGPSFHASDDYPTVFLEGEVSLGDVEIFIQ